jgi:hypothetical protein
MSVARAARHRRLARRGADSFAVFASLMPAHRNLGLGAEDCLLKLQGHVLTQVGPSLAAASSPRASSKHLAEAEAHEFVQDVAQVDRGRPATSAIDPRMAKLIVSGSLVGVGQYRIGFTALFEFLFRIRIIGVPVGMKLKSQLAVGALDLLIGGGSGYP